MKRRDFIKKSTLTAGALAASGLLGQTPKALAAEENKNSSSNAAKMPKRPFAKTGIDLSIIGYGGIVVMDNDQSHANQSVAEAVDKGINYFDVAPAYGDGEAEIKLGSALEPYRKNSFLACKTGERKREGAAFELKQSLQRLRTDYLDLYQLHAISDVKEDVDVAFARGGAMEVFIEAKKAGQIRYLGFSAHSEEAAVAAMERFDFDSILFPINYASYLKGEFGPRVVAMAKEKGLARLALKTLARQKWPSRNDPLRKKFEKCWYQPIHTDAEADLSVRWTLSQDVTAAISPGEQALYDLAVRVAMDFKPLTAQEHEKVAAFAADKIPLFAARNKA